MLLPLSTSLSLTMKYIIENLFLMKVVLFKSDPGLHRGGDNLKYFDDDVPVDDDQ